MFRYYYTKAEANFGKPIKASVSGGTHITFEIWLKYQGKFVGLRWKNGVPNHPSPGNKLYFCHDLIRFGESVFKCISRIVKAQAGAKVKDVKVFTIDDWVDEDNHWHIVPNVVAELADKPKPPKDVTEVVYFTGKNIPRDFGWWKKEELADYIKNYNL